MSLYFKNLSKSRRNSLEKYEIWDVTRHDTGKFEGDPNFTNKVTVIRFLSIWLHSKTSDIKCSIYSGNKIIQWIESTTSY